MISLTPQERKVLLFLMFLFVLGFGISFYKKTSGSDSCLLTGFIPETSGRRIINLNNATREELIGLPGIGEVTADAILSYRSTHGKFSLMEDLKNIKGINAKKLELLKKYISLDF